MSVLKSEKKYHTVRSVPKVNSKIVEIGKIDDRSLSWLRTDTLIKFFFKQQVADEANLMDQIIPSQ